MNENAKIIFNILNVDPNEEFKIKGSNQTFLITEELLMYDNQGHTYFNLLRKLILYPELIERNNKFY